MSPGTHVEDAGIHRHVRAGELEAVEVAHTLPKWLAAARAKATNRRRLAASTDDPTSSAGCSSSHFDSAC